MCGGGGLPCQKEGAQAKKPKHHQGRPAVKGQGAPVGLLVLSAKGALHCTNSSTEGGRGHHSFACSFGDRHAAAGRPPKGPPDSGKGCALHKRPDPTAHQPGCTLRTNLTSQPPQRVRSCIATAAGAALRAERARGKKGLVRGVCLGCAHEGCPGTNDLPVSEAAGCGTTDRPVNHSSH